MDVLFISGIMNFIIHSISFSVVLLIQHLKNDNILLSQFSEFYEELGIWPILGRFFFGLVFVGFSVGIIEFLILDKLTPNYVIISYEMGKIPASIVVNESVERWLLLIISIFQIIGLLFYLEIFEYNFCSLNKNTKRLISIREKHDSEIVNNDYEDKVSIGGYYISEFTKKSKEMVEKQEEKKDDEENN